MRRLEESNSFKRDKKKILRSGRYGSAIEKRFKPAVIALMNDIPLDRSYYDHPLHGDLEGCRECHILFDLLLVYRKVDDDLLILDRLDSHSRTVILGFSMYICQRGEKNDYRYIQR